MLSLHLLYLNTLNHSVLTVFEDSDYFTVINVYSSFTEFRKAESKLKAFLKSKPYLNHPLRNTPVTTLYQTVSH